MASTEVEIETLSYLDGAKPVHWVSDGGTEYEISEGQRTERGTTITLHISEEFKDFAEVYKVKETINKYCENMYIDNVRVYQIESRQYSLRAKK